MRSTQAGNQFRSWGWIAALYLGIGLLDAGQTVSSMHAEGMHHTWVTLFCTTFLSWLPWAIATPLVFRLADRLQLEPVSAPSFWLMHLGAVLSIGVVTSLWRTTLDTTLHPYAPEDLAESFLTLWSQIFEGGILGYLVLYGFVLAMKHVLDSRERLEAQKTETARLNEKLASAQLDALRRQMEPHFLFNSLNAIAGLVREQRNDDAVSSIVRLSDFLRRIVTEQTRAETSLQTEVELLQLYLRVQQLRFADRLQFSLDIPNELMNALVPGLLLQPLVENAIKHGISKRARGGWIRIGAARAQDRLTLTVYNEGPSLATPEPARTGVGMSNLRARLQILYGTGGALSLQNHPPDGVQVLVSVPFRER
jgi:two-component system LytT family sensor kinase